MNISIKWLGHAGFEIKADGKTIYIDPYGGERKDKADLILMSHLHFDHCDTSYIERIRKDGTLITAPADCVSIIGGNVKSLKPGKKVSAGNITVEAVEAYNYKRFRSPGTPFHPKGLGVGYLMTMEDKTIYHAGDTDFIPEMKKLENICLALLPSGGTYTMDNLEAAEATLGIKTKYVIPMHRFNTSPEEFKKEVEGRSKIKVLLLEPGEQFEV